MRILRTFIMLAVAVLIAMPTGAREDDPYYRQIDPFLFDRDLFEIDMGREPVDIDFIVADDAGYTLTYTLDQGFYMAYAEADTRCSDLYMTVKDSNGNILAQDLSSWVAPTCNFGILESGQVTIEFDVSVTPGDYQTYIAYVLSFVHSMDDRARQDHIQTELDALEEYANYEGEDIIGLGTDSITPWNSTIYLDYDLSPGPWHCEAVGGLTITNLDMAVYDESGVLLAKDTFNDNRPIANFELKDPATVSILISAVEIPSAVDESYVCWVLSTNRVLGDMGGFFYGMSPGFNPFADVRPKTEAELAANAESLAEDWMAMIRNHGEVVIEIFTEPLNAQDETQGWEHEIELGEAGVYHLYAQGDDICLTDIDMVVYDENGEVVDRDDSISNSPFCSIEVGEQGFRCTVVVYAYTLDCGVGYFKLIITRE